ncbi:MAG TPA: hypothetical protein VGY97_03200, partial [Solirubrobacteraceae bacterium]|nr:hypothetical protein [Solirubrobacteraceae bacterium]
MWRRAWLLAGLPLLAAAALAGLLFLSPAPARTAARAAAPLAPRKLRAPKAERVRPRAFASCAGLVAYARQHFATTHGVPDPPIQPVSEPVPTRAPGAPAPAASAPAQGGATNGTTSTSYSTTNVQEAG